MWKKGNCCVVLVGMKTCVITLENCMEVSQKKKPTRQPSNSTSGYFSEQNKNTNSKNMFFAPLFSLHYS